MTDNALKVWLGDVSADEAQCCFYLSWLDTDERRQASLFKNARLRWRYIAIHAKTREILAEVVGCKPEKIRLQRTQHGKPYLVDYPDIAFNLSHTENSIALVVGYRCRLGIDIERCKARLNLFGLVEKCFSEEEKRYWQQLPENLRIGEFYRFWTRKEAFVKATGRGIAVGLSRCVINPYRPTHFLSIPVEFGSASNWHIHEIIFEKHAEIVGALVMNTAITRTVEPVYF